MSEFDGKKPSTKEELVKLLSTAKQKEVEMKESMKSKSTKPTVSGVAEILKVHRDTLYDWMKEFGVKF